LPCRFEQRSIFQSCGVHPEALHSCRTKKHLHRAYCKILLENSNSAIIPRYLLRFDNCLNARVWSAGYFLGTPSRSSPDTYVQRIQQYLYSILEYGFFSVPPTQQPRALRLAIKHGLLQHYGKGTKPSQPSAEAPSLS